MTVNKEEWKEQYNQLAQDIKIQNEKVEKLRKEKEVLESSLELED